MKLGTFRLLAFFRAPMSGADQASVPLSPLRIMDPGKPAPMARRIAAGRGLSPAPSLRLTSSSRTFLGVARERS